MNDGTKGILKKIVPSALLRRAKENFTQGQKSYSQCGEDIIVAFIFNLLKTPKPSYLDIGTYHPTYFNNTYLLYKGGSRGVCVEPDSNLLKRIKQKRPGDTCLNVGIGTDNQREADFFVMSIPTLNTFSRESAEKLAHTGVQIAEVKKVPLMPINQIIAENFSECPHFVSIDAEGFDYDILKTFDFEKYRPQVFCVETTTYSGDFLGEKTQPVIDYMLSKGYMVFGDTYINTIFVDKKALKKGNA